MNGRNPRKAVIIGAGNPGCVLAQWFAERPRRGAEIAGFFDGGRKTAAGRTVLGDHEDAPAYVKKHHVDIVYIAPQEKDTHTMEAILPQLLDSTATVFYVLSKVLCKYVQYRKAQFLNGKPYITTVNKPFCAARAIVNRADDIAAAGVNLHDHRKHAHDHYDQRDTQAHCGCRRDERVHCDCMRDARVQCGFMGEDRVHWECIGEDRVHCECIGDERVQCDYMRDTRVHCGFMGEDRVHWDCMGDARAPYVCMPEEHVLHDILRDARVHFCGDIPVITIVDTPFRGVKAMVKRAEDIAAATLILAVVSPLMALIAIAVKASSPGPVIFKQWRYGLNGRKIQVWKFRTMTVLEDGYTMQEAVSGDARVTKVGRFLRKFSLDELPQFFNVLQGTMSVVGPRPHAISQVEEYRKRVNGAMLRHKVKPGITGLAQLFATRGEVDTHEKLRERIRLDLQYLYTWSFWLDVKIILLTVVEMVNWRREVV